MKRQRQYQLDESPCPVNISPFVEEVEAKHHGVEFGPSEQDIAKRAYYLFLNQGSLSGFDILHWQEAEAQLVEERNCILARGLPIPSEK